MFSLLSGTVNRIGFEGLGIAPFDVNRVAFTIGDFQVYWYGVIIAFGMLLAVLFSCAYSKKVGLKPDDILDGILYCLLPALVGARLFYVVFALDHYRTASGALDFAAIVNVRDGGLAIYGGIIVGFLVGWLMCHFKRISMLAMFDVVSIGFMIGQAVGRWGNFMNAEAYGYETTLPWGMTINGEGPYHPTFLYESLWNLLGIVLLLLLAKFDKKRNGETFLEYFIWYGAGRAVIEGLRTDSLWVFNAKTEEALGFNLRISQVIGIVFAVVGFVLLVLLRCGVFDSALAAAEERRRVGREKDAARKAGKSADYNPLFGEKETVSSQKETAEEEKQEPAATEGTQEEPEDSPAKDESADGKEN